MVFSKVGEIWFIHTPQDTIDIESGHFDLVIVYDF